MKGKKDSFIRIFGVLIFIGFFPFTTVMADSETEWWPSLAIDLKLSKKFKLYFEGQYRFDEGITEEKCKFLEVGAGYRIKRWVRVRVNYRLSDYPEGIRNRFDANLTLRFKTKKIILLNRIRFQTEMVEGLDTAFVFRDRIKIKYQFIKRVIPFIGTELFLSINDVAKIEDRVRFTAGVEIVLLKKLDFGFSYHHQRTLRSYNLDIDNIFATQLSYSF